MNKKFKQTVSLIAISAGTMYGLNKIIDAISSEKNVFDDHKGNYYKHKHGSIYYTVQGLGSPILLIHDLNAVSSSYEWCRLEKKLAANHKVYTLDLLGCGHSDKPCLTYTNYLYVQLLNDFVQEVIGEKPDVIVTHRSVPFTILTQNMYPDLLGRIIAINPPALENFCHKYVKASGIRKVLLNIPVFGTYLYNFQMGEEKIGKFLRETCFGRSYLVSSKMIDAYYKAAHLHHSHGKYLLSSIENNYIDTAISHALTKSDQPLYVIMGRDCKNAVSIANTYEKLHPQTKTYYLAAAKLTPQLEMPDKVMEVINKIL